MAWAWQRPKVIGFYGLCSPCCTETLSILNLEAELIPRYLSTKRYVSCEVYSSIKLREIVCTIYSMIWPSVKDFIALIFMTRYYSRYIVNILFFMAVIVQSHSQTSVSSNHGGTNKYFGLFYPIICHHALVTKLYPYSPPGGLLY